jgi:uncharacterized Zn finger protein
MQALDGNSIGGQLFEYFGRDMTTATGSCRHCGASRQIAELMVYSRAPGAVARCPSCGGVVIVLVEIRGSTRVHLDYFALDESEAV